MRSQISDRYNILAVVGNDVDGYLKIMPKFS